MQAAWRASNPEYFTQRRLALRVRAAEKAEEAQQSARMKRRQPLPRAPAPMRVPPSLRVLPWDWAQSEIGVAQTAFLAVLASRVLVVGKSERLAQVTDSKGLIGP